MRVTGSSVSRTVSPLAAVLCVAFAFWPVWVWYWSRVTDGSDEPWGVLALVTVVGTLLRQPIPRPVSWQITGACLIMIGYFATFHYTLPLIRAAMAMSALALILARAPSPLGMWTLLLLSLPVVPSLQFYLGYPLRTLVAQTSEAVLHMGGLAVLREGTALRWAGETVLVDAPCSGLKMVWAGIYFAATLACCRRLGAVSTFVLLVVTGMVIVAANILRSTLLFFKEAHIIAAPDWTHSAAGLLVFAVAALTIQWLCSRLQRRCVV